MFFTERGNDGVHDSTGWKGKFRLSPQENSVTVDLINKLSLFGKYLMRTQR